MIDVLLCPPIFVCIIAIVVMSVAALISYAIAKRREQLNLLELQQMRVAKVNEEWRLNREKEEAVLWFWYDDSPGDGPNVLGLYRRANDWCRNLESWTLGVMLDAADAVLHKPWYYSNFSLLFETDQGNFYLQCEKEWAYKYVNDDETFKIDLKFPKLNVGKDVKIHNAYVIYDDVQRPVPSILKEVTALRNYQLTVGDSITGIAYTFTGSEDLFSE